MTFTLEEFDRLYIREIVRLHRVPLSIVLDRISGLRLILEEFPESHGDTVDDEHCLSSLDGRSVREDHSNFRGHASGMHPRS